MRHGQTPVLLLALAAWAGDARADEPATLPTKPQCADAYVQGQLARKEGRLRAARYDFRVCASPACPATVGHDCRKWRDEIDGTIPSVVFDVRDARGDLATDTKVEMDGVALVDALDGRAVDVDPGKHVFVFRLRDGRVVRRDLSVLEGVKAQRVEIEGAPAGAPAPRSDAGTARPSSTRPVPPLVWVLGGVGAIGLGAFTVLGLSANARERELRSTCAPTCPESDREHVRALQIGADLSLIAGLVALGVGSYLFFTRPEVQPARTARAPGWSF